MNFTLIEEEHLWEKQLLSRPEANFLQSWHFAQFAKSLGKKYFAVLIEDNGLAIGQGLLIKEEAKRGNYLTIAGGPLLDWQLLTTKQLTEIFAYFKKLAKDNHCQFLRFRPQALDSQELANKLASLGIKPASMHLTADLTLQLNLSQSEEELLLQMRKNTRYEIKKALKLGIEVKTSQDPALMTRFYQDQLYLANKHQFVPFSYEFLHNQFKEFASHNLAMLFDSYYQGKLLASAFVIFYNQEAVYHYGTSTPDNQRLPGSYICQWQAILEAKKRGCKFYNFWGIAPENQPHHRFAGVSLFKRGFGGEEVAYLPAQDLPVSKQYWLTRGFEWVRKKMRRL